MVYGLACAPSGKSSNKKKAAIEGVVKAARRASKGLPTEEASKKGKGSKEKAKAASEGKPNKKVSKKGKVWKKK